MYKLTFTSVLIFFFTIVIGQKNVSKEITGLLSAGTNFKEVSLFKFQTADLSRDGLNLKGLKKGTILSLQKGDIQALFQGKNDFFPFLLSLKTSPQLPRHYSGIYFPGRYHHLKT